MQKKTGQTNVFHIVSASKTEQPTHPLDNHQYDPQRQFSGFSVQSVIDAPIFVPAFIRMDC
jgi:hypothetical protein